MNHNINSALSDMIQDMDIGDQYSGSVRVIEDGHYEVTITAKQNANKFAVFDVEYYSTNTRVIVNLLRRSQLSPLFTEMLLENIAIQIDPNYYD
jgi:hypothetical protein